jgi:AhpD family alkylhydroperoxidase
MPKPHLRRVPPEALPPGLADARARALDVRGDGTFLEVMGNAPEVFDWYSEFYARLFHGGRVPAPIKELVRLRLSTEHGCRFCNLGNRRAARAAGLTDEQIEGIGDWRAGPYSEAEKAALELADQMVMTNMDGHLSAALYRRLRTHYDDAMLVELGVVMAVLTGMARFLFVFDLVEREPNCPIGPTPD